MDLAVSRGVNDKLQSFVALRAILSVVYLVMDSIVVLSAYTKKSRLVSLGNFARNTWSSMGRSLAWSSPEYIIEWHSCYSPFLV